MELAAGGRAWIVLLALIPLLIYLLFRRRYQRRPLGTMLLLLRAYRRVRRSLRIKEMVLLVLRTAAMLAFLLALLNPLLGRTLGRKPRLEVFVLDVSLSMRAKAGGTSRFERAAAFVRERLGEMSEGDRAVLLAFDTEARRAAEGFLTAAEAERMLATVAPGYRRSRPFEAVSAALGTVRSKEAASMKREVFFLSDFAAEDWTEEELRRAGAVEELQALGSEARLVLVDCSGGAAANLAASGLTPGRGTFCKDLDTTLRCKVSRYAESGTERASFTLYRGGEVMGTRSFELAAGGSFEVSFPDRPREAGPAFYRISLPPDALAEDDERYLAVRVLDKLDVLLVDGRPGADPFRTASGFVRAALEPSDVKDVSPVRPRVMDAADFELYDGPLPRVVMLLDPPSLSEEAAARLEGFVRRGGGLLVACGPGMRTADISRRLGGERGLLPARLLSLQQGTGDSWLGAAEMKLPEPLEGMGVLWRSGLKRLKVFSYVEAEPLPDAETLITLEGGRPLLVGRKHGEGRVMLWTSGLDGEWTNLPALPMFPPLVHELCYYLAGGDDEGLNVTCGGTLEVRLPASQAGGSAVLASSGGESWEFSAETKGGEALLRYGPLEAPGLYRLTTSAGTSLYVAVNTPPEESDLTPATARTMRRLLKDVDFSWRRAGGSGRTAEERESAQLPLLLAALALLVAESFLAAWFCRPPKAVKLDFLAGGGA